MFYYTNYTFANNSSPTINKNTITITVGGDKWFIFYKLIFFNIKKKYSFSKIQTTIFSLF